MAFDMDTLPPSAAAEAVTGIVLTLLAYIGILFGIYKMCTTQRVEPRKGANAEADTPPTPREARSQ